MSFRFCSTKDFLLFVARLQKGKKKSGFATTRWDCDWNSRWETISRFDHL
jgi:hypothetical protein